MSSFLTKTFYEPYESGAKWLRGPVIYIPINANQASSFIFIIGVHYFKYLIISVLSHTGNYSFQKGSLALGNLNSRLLCHMCISKLKTFFYLEEKDRWGWKNFFVQYQVSTLYEYGDPPACFHFWPTRAFCPWDPLLHVKQTHPYIEKKESQNPDRRTNATKCIISCHMIKD